MKRYSEILTPLRVVPAAMRPAQEARTWASMSQEQSNMDARDKGAPWPCTNTKQTRADEPTDSVQFSGVRSQRYTRYELLRSGPAPDSARLGRARVRQPRA